MIKELPLEELLLVLVWRSSGTTTISFESSVVDDAESEDESEDGSDKDGEERSKVAI